ncbi:MAG: tail fiber domain-containing protein [Burkholderiales bacterium]|nr:tail fiber domain-containing protein [Burkholderiales bacterium]
MGGGSSSTSESGSAQKWAQPFAKQAAGDVQAVFNANQPQLNQITQGVTSLLPGISQRYTQGTPTLNAAKGLTAQTLGGSFLGGNPYLQNIINQTNRGVTDTVNSQFSLGGRYGSGAHTGVLAKQLADAEAGLRYQDYGTERGYQNQAIGQAGALEGVDNASLAALLQAAGVGAELPYTGINALSGGLGSLFSGGTQTQKSGGGFLNSLLGAAGTVGAAAIKPSDPSLKSNIEHIYNLEDGLGVYSYDYIAAPNDEIAQYMPEGRQIGVMADEVANLRPWALGPEIGGYMTVNYGAL